MEKKELFLASALYELPGHLSTQVEVVGFKLFDDVQHVPPDRALGLLEA